MYLEDEFDVPDGSISLGDKESKPRIWGYDVIVERN